MKKIDYLIVGAGFSGSTLAERLNSTGKKVLVIDKRNHIGGNCYDYYNKGGVLVHKYGPHYFRTDFNDVKDYLSRFTNWHPHEYRVRASIKGRLYTFPINRNTLNEFFGINLKSEEEAKEFLEIKRTKIEKPQNAEQQILAQVGRELYEAFFKHYTERQWGIHPRELDASVTARIPIRTNTDDRYVSGKFQAMPKDGYHTLFKNMLNGVEVWLNTSFKEIKDEVQYDKLIYTGPIDEFFNYRFGKLPYRSLRFKFETYEKEFFQDWVQINFPKEYDYSRIVEIKHATGQRTPWTTTVKDYPCAEGEPFYPVPNPVNRETYLKYQQEATKLKNVYFTGRLATYRYLNMDQVVKEALDLFIKIQDE